MSGERLSPVFDPAFRPLYAELGINPGAMGCVMLDVQRFSAIERFGLPEDDLYVAKDRERFRYVNGEVIAKSAHATLVYGLTPEVTDAHVHAVLAGWAPPETLTVKAVDVFPSPVPDEEPYNCIVAKLVVDPALVDGNLLLRALPHIDTFATFEPHVTIAYVHEAATERWVEAISSQLDWMDFDVTGLHLSGIRRGRAR